MNNVFKTSASAFLAVALMAGQAFGYTPDEIAAFDNGKHFAKQIVNHFAPSEFDDFTLADGTFVASALRFQSDFQENGTGNELSKFCVFMNQKSQSSFWKSIWTKNNEQKHKDFLVVCKELLTQHEAKLTDSEVGKRKNILSTTGSCKRDAEDAKKKGCAESFYKGFVDSFNSDLRDGRMGQNGGFAGLKGTKLHGTAEKAALELINDWTGEDFSTKASPNKDKGKDSGKTPDSNSSGKSGAFGFKGTGTRVVLGVGALTALAGGTFDFFMGKQNEEELSEAQKKSIRMRRIVCLALATGLGVGFIATFKK